MTSLIESMRKRLGQKGEKKLIGTEENSTIALPDVVSQIVPDTDLVLQGTGDKSICVNTRDAELQHEISTGGAEVWAAPLDTLQKIYTGADKSGLKNALDSQGQNVGLGPVALSEAATVLMVRELQGTMRGREEWRDIVPRIVLINGEVALWPIDLWIDSARRTKDGVTSFQFALPITDPILNQPVPISIFGRDGFLPQRGKNSVQGPDLPESLAHYAFFSITPMSEGKVQVGMEKLPIPVKQKFTHLNTPTHIYKGNEVAGFQKMAEVDRRMINAKVLVGSEADEDENRKPMTLYSKNLARLLRDGTISRSEYDKLSRPDGSETVEEWNALQRIIESGKYSWNDIAYYSPGARLSFDYQVPLEGAPTNDVIYFVAGEKGPYARKILGLHMSMSKNGLLTVHMIPPAEPKAEVTKLGQNYVYGFEPGTIKKDDKQEEDKYVSMEQHVHTPTLDKRD